MLPAEDYKLPGKHKFRPKMADPKMMSDKPSFEDWFTDYGDHFGAQGKFPVYVLGRKKIVLGEMAHSKYNYHGGKMPEKEMAVSHFRKIPHILLYNTTFITEAPQWLEKARDAMEEEDLTQEEVIKHALGTAGKKNRLVCADGRRTYDEKGKLHKMMGEYDRSSHLTINHDEISEERIIGLAERYLDHVLLRNSANISQFVSEVTDMIGNIRGASPGLVMQRTTDRVLWLINRLKMEQRKTLKESVLDGLQEDLEEAEDIYSDAIEELDEQESAHEENIYKKLQELRFKQELLPEKVYQKLVDEINEEAKDAVEALRMEEMERYNMNLLSCLANVFANVLLITEVANADTENVVVVCGKSHHNSLKRMIGQFKQKGM